MSATLEVAAIDDFIAIAIEQLRITLGVDAACAPCATASTDSTIGVTLELVGELVGSITWVFPVELALGLVRRLTAAAAALPVGSDFAGAAELANILTGQALQAFEDRGFRFELGIPRRQAGAIPASAALRMMTAVGMIELELALGKPIL